MALRTAIGEAISPLEILVLGFVYLGILAVGTALFGIKIGLKRTAEIVVSRFHIHSADRSEVDEAPK